MATTIGLMTEEEFLALPEQEGVERDLIRGELRERSMTTRSFAHGIVISNSIFVLKTWLRGRPDLGGCVVGGETRVRLRRDQPTFVGVDVAYVPSEARPAGPRGAKFVDGPPSLVIEVLSPSDKSHDTSEKIKEYLSAGVPIIWIADPQFSTIVVHRPDAKPQLFNSDQEITAEPHLPGFRCPVAELFEDLDD